MTQLDLDRRAPWFGSVPTSEWSEAYAWRMLKRGLIGGAVGMIIAMPVIGLIRLIIG